MSKVAMTSAWPDVSQEGDMCQRRLSSRKLSSHYDEGHFLSMCACFAVRIVYLWTAFGTSGGQWVLSVPDRTRYIWSRQIIIAYHVQIGRGKQADRFTHFCIWSCVGGHTSLKIRFWNNNQFIVLLRLGRIFNSTD